jgi:hypothetical protein
MQALSGTISIPPARERTAVRLRLALHFARYAAAFGSAHARSRAAVDPVQLDVYWPNVRASLDWAARESLRSDLCDQVWATLGLCELLLHRTDAPTRLRWCAAQLRAARRLADRRLEAQARIGLGLLSAHLPGGVLRAEKMLRAAEAAGRELGAHDILAQAMLARAEIVAEHGLTWTQLDARVVDDLAREVHAVLPLVEGESPRLETRLWLVLASVQSTLPERHAAAQDAVERAERLLAQAPNPFLEALLIAAKLNLVGVTGPYGVRRALARASFTSSVRLGSQSAQAGSLIFLAGLSLERGDIDAVEAYIARMRALPARASQAVLLWNVLRETLAGRFDAAEHGVKIAAQAASGTGYSRHRIGTMLATQRLVIAYLRGDSETCLAIAKVSRELLPDDRRAAAVRAQCFAMAGRRDEARAEMRLAGTLSEHASLVMGLFPLWALAEAATDLEDVAVCDMLYDRLLPLAERVITTALVAMALGTTDRMLSRLARVRGDLDASIAFAARAVQSDERMRAVPWAALSRIDAARAHLTRGAAADLTAARELLASARATAAKLGMAGALAACDALIRAAH